MCKFKSAIAVEDGKTKGGFRLLANQWTESHTDLIALFKLRDDAKLRFARVEFYPDNEKDMATPAKYTLHIDEERTPEWFDQKKQDACVEQMRGWIKAMIVEGEAEILCGGAYILAKGAKVQTVKNAIIHVMLESSKVGVMRESSNVGGMWGSSNVGVMRESSKVGEMRESSKVGVMRESSNVGVMRESSKVGEMRESSKVGEMWESSKVGEMWESSKVGEMWGSSKVGVMRESSKVGVMRESSNVGGMWGSSNVGVMRESSKVTTDNREKKAP